MNHRPVSRSRDKATIDLPSRVPSVTPRNSHSQPTGGPGRFIIHLSTDFGKVTVRRTQNEGFQPLGRCTFSAHGQNQWGKGGDNGERLETGRKRVECKIFLNGDGGTSKEKQSKENKVKEQERKAKKHAPPPHTKKGEREEKQANKRNAHRTQTPLLHR